MAPHQAKRMLESAMAEIKKARAMGLNHVALEVGDIEEALTSMAA